MFKNHLRVAFRNILRQKVYNLLNAAGLATGIACGLVIALHIREELSYEKDFDDYEKIYRVHEDGWAKSSPPMALEMSANLPQIQAITRFAAHGTHVVNTDENNPGESRGYFADSTVFDVFSYRIVDGDRKQALRGVNTVVITESMAKRYFGSQNAVGKTLRFDNQMELAVIAVIQDPPVNSHIRFDYLLAMPRFYENVAPDWANHRGWMVMYTYAKFRNEADHKAVLDLWPQFIRKFYVGFDNLDQMVANQVLKFTPLADIHLRSNLEQEMGANSSILYIYIFIAVEILILVIACANFTSLFTTQAIKRMKEVGMRKIMGAKPRQLMAQFFTEVLLLTMIALVLAILFYQVLLPFYNSLSGKSLSEWQIFEKKNLAVIGSILLFIVLVSGLYPAFFITRFRAGSFLKDDKLPNSMSSRVRSGLVVFQFIVSTSLIAATVLVQQQMDLMKNKDLGFDKDQVINIGLNGSTFAERSNVKNELLKNAGILAVGRTGNMVGDNLSVESVVPEGKEEQRNDFSSVRVMRVDEDYLDAMNIKLAAGRNFSTEFNDSSSYILNENAVKMLGLTNPVGQRVNNVTMKKPGNVVGVVKDYHFASLHNVIEPLVLEYKPEWTGLLTVKLRAGSTEESIAYIQATVDRVAPDALFSYEFLDERLNMLYKSEDNMGKVFSFFSLLAIVIACMGLLGLSAYTVESRTKEIGIRKVLGATVSGIITLVSSQFFRLVAMGFLIAVPLTWYVMHQWLQNFAYHMDIQWWVFALTGAIIFAITLGVISFHTVAAAVRNPVKALRYE